MDKVIELVQRLGFPIACSILLFVICFYSLERNTQALHALDVAVNKLVIILSKGQ